MSKGGRCRNRLRHVYRASRQRALRSLSEITVATQNCGGIHWNVHGNADVLRGLIEFAREQKTDFLILSELENEFFYAEGVLTVVHMEEFTLVMAGEVGVMMPVHVRVRWEEQGRRMWYSGDRTLAIAVDTEDGDTI
mmetsp:Transcript_89530/g.267050  ORF Transcript_89530/g.267050 Transcript_89530/m.267050 type:complete len:137 (+) Transcript_89530:283-693(+)